MFSAALGLNLPQELVVAILNELDEDAATLLNAPLGYSRPYKIIVPLPIKLDHLRPAYRQMQLYGAAAASMRTLSHTSWTTLRVKSISRQASLDSEAKLDLFPNLQSLHFYDFRQTTSFSLAQGIARLFTDTTTRLPLEEVEISLSAWSSFRKEAVARAETFVWAPCREIDEFLARNDCGRLRTVKVWFLSLDMGDQPHEAGIKLRRSFPTSNALSNVNLEVSIAPERSAY
ncbi:hypothetical protein FPV67DRAFT_1665488 [Lyophyllum atratum]|nr:hypothetical protein FPV67DRAFT_1665488 [Lyophyllum atratum]